MVAGGALAAMLGCSQVLGIHDWQDPPGSGGAGGTSSVPTSTTGDAPSCALGVGIDAGGATDVGCGGDACPPCANGKKCLNDTDCMSGSCQGGICAVLDGKPPCESPDAAGPTCYDCTQDGLETDVDCGGDACLPCAASLHCLQDGDCLSGHCDQRVCATGAPGTACRTAVDCTSGHCSTGKCWTGQCCQ
jgi:hypothetical protein